MRDRVDLHVALATVGDPRARRAVRHGFVAVLAIGICAVLAGARTPLYRRPSALRTVAPSVGSPLV